ncbi:MAG TPA: V-type ATP synthase subunit F [Candidatus Hydrogenedentes bacterium]|nr:V-type ATP synthase subunit F [Candidatus Hydrogenedentota bacterium]HPU96666.1 V-type ATP synthase subunit F [Candidatus Hydrogenedentota bacterium]
MSKAIVVGERSLILGFRGVGMEVVPAEDAEGLRRALGPLSRDADVALVLVTESLAAQAPDALDDFRSVSRAVITTIPTHMGSTGFAFKEMRSVVERSIGVDMLGKD